jgi:hypothetical protein
MSPQFPVYIISKGRSATPLTARCLERSGIPFRVVIEPQEYSEYAAAVGANRLLVLPFSNLGLGSIPARNWVWEHAKAEGYKRHWIFDDNIRGFLRIFKGKRIQCSADVALDATEEFTERYENIALSGFNYSMFCFPTTTTKPFNLNTHVYSCLLINNDLPYRWRGRYNEDTDLCLQVLSNDWCTVLMNAFIIHKMTTMTMRGGNSEALYQGDGRLKMARSLERQWPGVVETKRRFKRPQHVIKDAWRRFDTPLKLKPGIDLSTLPKHNEYGMELVQVKPIKSKALQKLYAENSKPRHSSD